MVTDRDKAIIGGILAAIAWLLAQKGVKLPVEVAGAFETILTWTWPVLAGLVSSIVIFYTRNKPYFVREKEAPAVMPDTEQSNTGRR